MLILHPQSVCDICLEGYNNTNAPYAIACGHIFCLRCLNSLIRPCCPMCRSSFDMDDIRKLHIDKVTSRSSTPAPTLPPTADDTDEPTSRAKELQSRITRVVLGGALSKEVRELLEEVRRWISAHGIEENSDLHAAYLLLFKYTDLQYKIKEEKNSLSQLREEYNQLHDTVQIEREAAEARQAELSSQLKEERDVADTQLKNMQQKYDQMDHDWRGKYEVCVAECKSLMEEIRRSKHNPLPLLPRPNFYGADRMSYTSEPINMLKDDHPISRSPPKARATGEEVFALSPISNTVPIPPLASIKSTFRPLTAEDSDAEEVKNKHRNPYNLRSIDPIPIRSNVHRRASNASLLSRHETEPIPRSFPRSIVDVNMESCSSSPMSTFQYAPRERHTDPAVSSSMSSNHDSPISRRPMADSRADSRRPSISSRMETQEDDHEQQRERWRAQLRDLLDHPEPQDTEMTPRNPEQELESKPTSPDSSNPVTRHPSPVSPYSPYHSSQSGPIQNSLLQRPPLSRASTAAMQAERERARALSLRDREPPHTSSATQSTTASPHTPHLRPPERDRESPHIYAGPQSKPPSYPSRSASGSLRVKPNSNTTGSSASNLTRSLWGHGMNPQEGQRV